MSAATEEARHVADLDVLRAFSVVKTKPSREQLEDSALAWGQTCNSNLHSLLDELAHGDAKMAAGALRGLEASIVRLRAVFDEMEKL